MKLLKIAITPFEIKGDVDDELTLQVDIFERVQSMLDAETLTYEILEEEDEEL